MWKILGRLGAALSFLGLLASVTCCASNPYTKFYTSVLGDRDVSEVPGLIPNTARPAVVPRNLRNLEQDNIKMLEAGYVMLGYAAFTGAPTDRTWVVARAWQLKAAAAIAYTSDPTFTTETVPANNMLSVFAQSLSDQMSGRGQETTHTSGTIYGSSGLLNYTETSTTSSSSTPSPSPPQYRQQTRAIYQQGATFWARSKPRRLGIWARELTDEEQVALGGYKGVAVLAVVKGSPAFQADILRGDIVTTIGDVHVRLYKDLERALDLYGGTEVSITVIRKADADTWKEHTERTVHVHLNKSPDTPDHSNAPLD